MEISVFVILVMIFFLYEFFFVWFSFNYILIFFFKNNIGVFDRKGVVY